MARHIVWLNLSFICLEWTCWNNEFYVQSLSVLLLIRGAQWQNVLRFNRWVTIATESLAGQCVAQLVKGFFSAETATNVIVIIFKYLYTAAVDLFFFTLRKSGAIERFIYPGWLTRTVGVIDKQVPVYWLAPSSVSQTDNSCDTGGGPVCSPGAFIDIP